MLGCISESSGLSVLRPESEVYVQLIFNSVRLADKVDPEFVGASDWLRKEGATLAAAAAEVDGELAGADVADAAATQAASEPLPPADKALGGFTSPTQFAPAAFRVRREANTADLLGESRGSVGSFQFSSTGVST